MTHIYLLIYPAVLLMIGREFGATKTELGQVYTVGLFFGVTALPTGWLVSRLGAPLVLSVGFLGAAAASFAVGFADSLTRLTWCLLFLHVALGVYHPAAGTLISHYCPRRGHALGLHGTFGSFGEALGPLLAVLLAGASIGWWTGWRGAYVPMAVPGLLLALGFLLLAPVLPARDRFDATPPDVERFFNRGLLLTFTIMLCNGFLYRTTILFLPTYLDQAGPQVEWLGGNAVEGLRGGIVTSLVLGIGGMGQWLAGRLADRYNLARLLMLFFAGTAAALLGMALSTSWVLVACGLLLGFVYFMVQPVIHTLIAHHSTAENRGWAYALGFFLQFGPGALGQAFGGYIGDVYGLPAIYVCAAAWSLGIVGVAFWLGSKR